jgi:CheY-like chemotaxis protein
MQMPEMDGASLGLAIRDEARLSALPLVLMPSLVGHGDAARVHSVGFAACLTKPVRQSELLATLSAILSGSAPRPAEKAPARKPTIPKLNLHARILLADDNVTNQLVAVGMLRKMGLSADAVANGEEASSCLRRAVRSRPDGRADAVLDGSTPRDASVIRNLGAQPRRADHRDDGACHGSRTRRVPRRRNERHRHQAVEPHALASCSRNGCRKSRPM